MPHFVNTKYDIVFDIYGVNPKKTAIPSDHFWTFILISFRDTVRAFVGIMPKNEQ